MLAAIIPTSMASFAPERSTSCRWSTIEKPAEAAPASIVAAEMSGTPTTAPTPVADIAAPIAIPANEAYIASRDQLAQSVSPLVWISMG